MQAKSKDPRRGLILYLSPPGGGGVGDGEAWQRLRRYGVASAAAVRREGPAIPGDQQPSKLESEHPRGDSEVISDIPQHFLFLTSNRD